MSHIWIYWLASQISQNKINTNVDDELYIYMTEKLSY
jgi:hypothetical protein